MGGENEGHHGPLASPRPQSHCCSAAFKRARRRAIIRTGPIRIVVPYPAGGIVDIVARTVTEQVGRDFKQAIVVEARPGGNSNIGTASVARSDPDGYTWLVTGPAALVNPTLYKDAGWDPMQGLKCVGLAIWNQSVAVVNTSMPAKTLKEFVELARSKPGHYNFGNPGTGSSIDLTRAKTVPDRRRQADQCRLQGPAAGADRPDHQPDAFRNRLAGAGIAAHQGRAPSNRSPYSRKNASPTCPMCRPSPRPAIPDASYVSWYGIYVPSATPDALAEKINQAINKALHQSRRPAPAFDRRHPRQADVAEGTRGADEGRPREADDRGQDFRDEALQ